ncbi:hypothetical protein M9458_048979, partial [Cirrhinus mrigala]
AQQQTFQFPDIFPEKDKKHEEGSVEEMQEKGRNQIPEEEELLNGLASRQTS